MKKHLYRSKGITFFLGVCLILLYAVSVYAAEQEYGYDKSIGLEGEVILKDAVINLGEGKPSSESQKIHVLKLAKPITVVGNLTDPINFDTERNVSELQLIDVGDRNIKDFSSRWNTLTNYANTHIKVAFIGKLIHAHTVHHITKVLLLYSQFKKVNK